MLYIALAEGSCHHYKNIKMQKRKLFKLEMEMTISIIFSFCLFLIFLASRKALWGVTKWKVFKGKRASRQGSQKQKEGLFQARSPSSKGRVEACHLKITSLVLIRKFQANRFKMSSLEDTETVIRLGIKSWFADVGLSTSDSIRGLLFLF